MGRDREGGQDLGFARVNYASCHYNCHNVALMLFEPVLTRTLSSHYRAEPSLCAPSYVSSSLENYASSFVY